MKLKINTYDKSGDRVSTRVVTHFSAALLSNEIGKAVLEAVSVGRRIEFYKVDKNERIRPAGEQD